VSTCIPARINMPTLLDSVMGASAKRRCGRGYHRGAVGRRAAGIARKATHRSVSGSRPVCAVWY